MRLWVVLVASFSMFSLGGCGTPSAMYLAGAREQAAIGIVNPALRSLLVDHWVWALQADPIRATDLGVHRFDDQLEDISETAIRARRRARREFVDRATRIRELGQLAPSDLLSLDTLLFDLKSAIRVEVCDLHQWSIAASLMNLLTKYNDFLPQWHQVDSEQDAENFVARYRKVPLVIASRIENLRRGLARGFVANARSIDTLMGLIERQLQSPDTDWSLMKPVLREREDWPAERQDRFQSQMKEAMEQHVRPAFERYVTFLREELRPHARGAANEGLDGIPDGLACYQALVASHTTLDVTPDVFHQRGLDEVQRIGEHMVAIGQRLFGIDELGSLVARLRSDPSLHFSSSDEIEAKARQALEAAARAAPRYFGVLPKAQCEVEPIAAYRAPYAPPGYYLGPSADGSRPGSFYVNTSNPASRPRYGLEALTFHESIPGHHLQLAISHELGGVPAFRRYGQFTAFVEGWGLYAESLAAEMGLYSSELDRLGQLNLEMWRANRLVADTGVHLLGWSRERAIGFMLDHTALSRATIETEVDRYITVPGQALAYKAGELELLRLRAHAKERLGDRFDIRRFHDAVLLQGLMPLPVLERRVNTWISQQLGVQGQAP